MNTTNVLGKVLYTPLDVARMLKLHPVTVRRCLRSGKLRAVCIGGKVMVDESSIQEFIESSTDEYRRKHGIGSPRKRTIGQRTKAADQAAAQLGVPITDDMVAGVDAKIKTKK